MPERRTIKDNLVIRYEGVFNLKELYKFIDKWQKEKGYDRDEKKNYEQVFESGRDIEIELEPWKHITESAKIVIRIIILIKKMKDILIKRDGKDVKMNQGQLQIKLAGFLVTDEAFKWEGKAYYHFLRTVFDKYVWKLPASKLDGYAAEELDNLYRNIKAYLNLIRR